MNKYRTHKCNELRKSDVDKNVSLSGWINKKRDHGNLLFVDLRDNYGVTQCVIDKSNQYFSKLEIMGKEWVDPWEKPLHDIYKDTKLFNNSSPAPL